jgi:hypothetical protein
MPSALQPMSSRVLGDIACELDVIDEFEVNQVLGSVLCHT